MMILILFNFKVTFRETQTNSHVKTDKNEKKASRDKYQWLSIFVLVSKTINIINHVRRLI